MVQTLHVVNNNTISVYISHKWIRQVQYFNGWSFLLLGHFLHDALRLTVWTFQVLLRIFSSRIIFSYEVYLLNYFTYSVHPFGIDKNTTEVLPRKPPLDEVIARSNIPGFGIHYFDIPDRAGITYLELEDSERYWLESKFE